MRYIIHDVEGLSEVATLLISLMKDYRIFLLEGELGTGKTTLVKQWLSQLGIEDPVTSPTFSIINEYHGNDILIYHMDMYRLKNIDEAFNIGIEEYLYDSGHYNIIEWPGLINQLITDPYVAVEMELDGMNRTIHVKEMR